VILRYIKAVKLLTRIRLERPDLWEEIVAFAKGQDRMRLLIAEAERDYKELFEGNLHRTE